MTKQVQQEITPTHFLGTTGTVDGSTLGWSTPQNAKGLLGLGTSLNVTANNGAGSAGTPAFSFTGDPNTGMFNQSTNVLAFSTDGSERMRANSSGGVSIGTTLGVTGGGNGLYVGLDALTGPHHMRRIFTTPGGAGVYTIQIFIAGAGSLDIAVLGSFGSTNREGDARYRVRFSRTTGTVDLVTVDAPRNAGGDFTSGYAFTVTKPDANTLQVQLTKPSGASYEIYIDGIVKYVGTAINNVTTSFA